MEPQLFDNLQQTLQTAGPAAAIDRLCNELTQRKDFAGLFYALLMKKRHELGVSPVPTGSNQDLPPELHQQFEDGIRFAAQTVGKHYLDDGNIPQAWLYYRMLGETAPIAAALEQVEPGEGEDCQPLIDIALHQGVLPLKGFDWVLQRYGLCSAITMMGGEMPLPQETRNACVKKLIRTLHTELMERLKAEIERQQGFKPTGTTVQQLIEGRDWLFADDFYHIDLSHLNSIVQMAMQLDNCEELALVRDMCAYGKRLSPRFRYQSEPPFEDQYADYDVFLSILTGENVEGGLAHFRDKVAKHDPREAGTYSAEIFVNLLMRLGRPEEALQVVKQYLAPLGELRLSCPSLVELCQQTRKYDVLAEVSREQGNLVNFVAGLIAAAPA